MMRSASLVLAARTAVALAATAAGVAAQDVEHLAEHYGTPLPDTYFELRARIPDAFRFEHGRAARARAAGRIRAPGPGGPGPLRALGPREGPVEGEFRFPVLLGLFSDSPQQMAFTPDTIEADLFGDHDGTITAFYSEMSEGRLHMVGEVHDWIRTSFTQAATTGGKSGLGGGDVGGFILDILDHVQGVDWGRYDNDGPDGIPNSGDDDGFVDVLAVLQPTPGAECGGPDKDDRIWSHRWALRYAAGHAFVTSTPSANGDSIEVDDYVIQPVFSCNGNDIIEIGVFAHELGHAFGLPDLYDTDKDDGDAQQGAGEWDLMASGSWGCDGNDPAYPCHMGAWSKAELGWLELVDLPAGEDLGTLSLSPVETTGRAYRIDAGDGSGEYFLLENRQRVGFDRNLHAPGLLIWHIDPHWVATHWGSNTVNADGSHLGVWLRQADGRNDLATTGGNRGDAGDPFPYVARDGTNDAFHAGSSPAAVSHAGAATGTTLLDIARNGSEVGFRLLTRYQTITVRSEGAGGAPGLFTVDGTSVEGVDTTFSSAPFEQHTVSAAEGKVLEPGVRTPFLRWVDDASLPAERTVVTPTEDLALVAQYGGRQVQLAVDILGGINGVSPGTIVTQPESPDLWFDEGASALVEAVPTTGFGFREWTGDLAGLPNPVQVTFSAPMHAAAVFELTYTVPERTISFPAATEQDIQLEALNATAPVFWTVVGGTLPAGIEVDVVGKVKGAAEEMGTFQARVRAKDARGLTAEGMLTLVVDKPRIDLARLAAPFTGVGAGVSQAEQKFLDAQGNGNGRYDLGDFRAWVLANPDLPMSAELRAVAAGATTSPVIGRRPASDPGANARRRRAPGGGR